MPPNDEKLTFERYQNLYDRVAELRKTLVDRLGPELIQNPQLGDAIVRQLDDLLSGVVEEEAGITPPADHGLSQLVGLGPDAARALMETRVPQQVTVYDETVTSERILAIADLYYLFQHDEIGVFQTVIKLQQLFRAGTIRLSSGPGAFGLYQFDRRQVLRFTRRDRLQAYRRVFGYTNTAPPPGAKPNHEFHALFGHFMTQVAQFYRDKRISELFQSRATDPGYGSIAVVRRAGLDLRNNLKGSSYGHINVLRVEVLQLLDEAFRILNTEDVKKLFGADNAWDVIEEVAKRHLGRQINASQRSRMAIAGRTVLRWLAQAHILNATRAEFEALLLEIADDAEEWLTSAEVLGRSPRNRRGRRLVKQNRRNTLATQPTRESVLAYD